MELKIKESHVHLNRGRKKIDKIPYPFMIKTFNKVSIQSTYLKTIKVICDKPTVNMILNGERLKVLRSETR